MLILNRFMKYKKVIILVVLCLLCTSSFVLGIIETPNTNTEHIIIVPDATNLELIDGIDDPQYYAGVKYIFQDNSEDVLDPVSVKWSSANNKIVEVKENGALIPKANGKTKIYAEYKGLRDNIELTVKKGRIKKLTLSSKSVVLTNEIYNKDSQNPYEFYATVTTSSGRTYDVTENRNLKWSTDNNSVATVYTGKVYSIKPGNSKITASFMGQTISSQVKVDNRKIKSFKLAKNKVTIDDPNVKATVSASAMLSEKQVTIDDVNGSVAVDVSALLSDGTSEDISKIVNWESDDSNIAVGCEDKIYARGEGETTLNVSYGDIKESIKVKVNKSVNLENQKFAFP